jgi:hypothetical protein
MSKELCCAPVTIVQAECKNYISLTSEQSNTCVASCSYWTAVKKNSSCTNVLSYRSKLCETSVEVNENILADKKVIIRSLSDRIALSCQCVVFTTGIMA